MVKKYWQYINLSALCLIYGTGLWGQEAIEKVYPSYTEDFSDNNTYPAICIEDAWQDLDGRLWLRTCRAVELDRLYLYSFDGYDFTLGDGIIDSVPTGGHFRGRLRDHVLFGECFKSVRDTKKAGIFIIDQSKDSIDIIYLEADNIANSVRFDDQTIVAASVGTGSWIISTVSNGMVTTEVIPMENSRVNSSSVESTLWHKTATFDGSEIWWLEADTIRSLDIRTRSTRSYATPKVPQPYITAYTFRIIKAGSRIFAAIRNFSGSHLFWLDQNTQKFIAVSGFTDTAKGHGVYEDDSGNTLIYTLYEQQGPHARLLTSSGEWLDYSAFFKNVKAVPLNAIGADFRRDFVICYSGGIILQQVRQQGAIVPVLQGMSIRAMANVNAEEILVTTQGSGNHKFNLISGSLMSLNMSPNLLGKNLVPEGDNIWASSQNGIVCLNSDLRTVYHVDTLGRIVQFGKIDDTHLVIVNTNKELYIFDTHTHSISRFFTDQDSNQIKGLIHDIYCGDGRILWVASSAGLYQIDLSTKSVHTLGKHNGFTDNRFICINPSEDGRLWLGTISGGIQIYNPNNGAIDIINSDRGLDNNTVVSITTDDEGTRWAGTYGGISMLEPNGTLIANITTRDGLASKECNRYASLKTQDGKLLIGTVSGLNVIDPSRVKSYLREIKPVTIYLTSLGYISGKHNNNTDTSKLSFPEEIILPAAKRSFRVTFALSNFFNAENHRYFYQLEGRDDSWRDLGNRNELEFDELPAGHYNLKIRGVDAAGHNSRNIIEISVHARAYIYEQWWFYILCLAGVAGLALLWIVRLRAEVKHATSQMRKDKETIEFQSDQLKELDEAKSRFFTNISHEFRTPLTIISGVTGQILENPQAWAVKGAEMIRTNSNTLLRLVNQILDLRKLQSSEMQLQLISGDIVSYIGYLIDSFKSYVSSTGKELSFRTSHEHFVMDFDPDKIMRIISNLVSNAVKHTDAGTQIEVRAHVMPSTPQEKFVLEIEDNGPGIAEDKLLHLFDLFYQAEDTSEGSGIGLALVKELTEVMGGRIDVKSKKGSGTTFVLTIPITKEIREVTEPVATNLPLQRIEVESEPASGTMPDDGHPTVLVVEDNHDVMKFIVGCLESEYTLILAKNGTEGIEKALEVVPDMVVSDIMMPGTDGYTLCKTLKSDMRTDHIPVILLTAKADAESRLTGLEYGADDYLTKPFDPKELRLRIANLLANRKLMQERYASGFKAIRNAANPSPQDIFLNMLTDAVIKHIDDENFGVMQLCREAHLGRTQLHNKLKALTGMSTTIFIRDVRLEKARELLQTTDMNVSEVSYAVGISDPKYFSRVYSEKFGEPPSRTSK